MRKKAWLHHDGKVWEFVLDPEKSAMPIHTTRYGTVYGILTDIYCGKPFWIGRLVENSWLTWERTLGARKIEFEDGGVSTVNLQPA